MNSALERMEKMTEGAKAAGIDLNYAPEVAVNTEEITNEEWQASMMQGIGSSSAGDVMGVSHFGDQACLVLKKLGMLPKENISAEKQFLFDFGHAVEEPMLKYFGAKMHFKVFVDRNRYKHPKYPFLFADLDGVAIDNDGMRVVVEMKSCTPQVLYTWKSGVYGIDGICPNPGYVWQGVHHLSVMNLDRLYWVVCATNNAAEIRIVRFDRNFAMESQYLNTASNIWNNYVQSGNIPEMLSCTDQAFQIRKSMYTPSQKKDVLELDGIIKGAVQQYYKTEAQLSRVKGTYTTAFNERKNALKLKILEGINGHEKAVCQDEDYIYTVSFKEGTAVEKVDINNLHLLHPELIEQLKKEGIISEAHRDPILRISRKVNRTCKK